MSPLDPDIEEKLKRTGAGFLSQDIETALTFIRLARSAEDNSEKKLRNQANARKAYDVVRNLAATLLLSPIQRNEINQKLGKLKIELEALGEHF
jgi:hypothetical protein